MTTLRPMLTVALMVAGAAILPAAPQAGAQATVADLRLARDDAGTAIEAAAAPPGEKLYHFDQGVDKLFIAFDLTGNEPADVEIRVTGPAGAVLFQEPVSYDGPGTKIVVFDNKGVPLQDNEYVVNAYVGTDRYLADSLQLTIGAAQIPTSQAGGLAPSDPTPQATLGAVGAPAADSAPSPGAPARWTMIMAIAGMLALFAVVVWAGWSAMRRG